MLYDGHRPTVFEVVPLRTNLNRLFGSRGSRRSPNLVQGVHPDFPGSEAPTENETEGTVNVNNRLLGEPPRPSVAIGSKLPVGQLDVVRKPLRSLTSGWPGRPPLKGGTPLRSRGCSSMEGVGGTFEKQSTFFRSAA